MADAVTPAIDQPAGAGANTVALALARALEAGRGRYNALYAQAQLNQATGMSQSPESPTASAFLAHVGSVLGPIVSAVDAIRPERTTVVLDELYILSLDLFAQHILGPTARQPEVTEGWRVVLPAVAAILAVKPRLVAVAVTNALGNLAATIGARPAEWIRSLVSVGPWCRDVNDLLAAGQVAAWRAGMAHYRSAALDLCRQLPTELARTVLGLPAEGHEVAISLLIDRLAADPWLSPAQAALNGEESSRLRTNKRISLVGRVGAFRGLGGEFLAPPEVGLLGEHFYVRDGERSWLLCADACGATLTRVNLETSSGERAQALAQGPTADSPFRLKQGGELVVGSQREQCPRLVQVKSWAANRTTLAAASPWSYAISLIASVEG